MISVLINPAHRAPVKNNKVRLIIKSFLKKKKIDNVEISLRFVGNQEMRKLNKKYRGVDRLTTVLSFCQQEEKEGQAFKNPPTKVKSLGDIIICPGQARKEGRTLESLLIHGLKNLIKFDGRQSRLLSEISSSKSFRT